MKFSIPHSGELIEHDFNSLLLSIIQDSFSNGELNFLCQFPKMFGIFLLVVVYSKILPVIWECSVSHKGVSYKIVLSVGMIVTKV